MSDGAQPTAATPAPVEPMATPAAAPSPTPTEPVATPAAPAEPWGMTFEDETMQGWFDSKGFKDQQTMAKSHYHLEKLNGAIQSGNAIDLPHEGSEQADWDNFHNKLGRPSDPIGYSFAQDNKDLAWIAEAMHGAGLTDKAASTVIQAYNDRLETVSAEKEQQALVQVQQDVESLKTEWGAAHEDKISQARSAAREFGLDEAAVEGMQKTLGYAGVMKFLSGIGAKVGQDTYIEGTPAGGSGNLTPAGAQAELTSLASDAEFNKAWLDKHHVGHAAAVEKKARLSKLAAGMKP